MFRGSIQAARNGHRLCDARISAQIEFSRVSHFTAHDEIRFLKILQLHVDYWVVQNLGVGAPQQINQFRYRLSIHLDAFHAAKGDISVRLDGHSLIELRCERKTQFQNIRGMQLIPAFAVLQHRCLSVFSVVPASARGNGLWNGKNCGGCLLSSCRDSSQDCQINQETSTRYIFVKHRCLPLSHDRFFQHDQSASISFGKPCAPDKWAASTGVAAPGASLNALGTPFGCTLSQWRSTSKAPDRCRSVTDRRSFNPDLIFTTIPVKPDRGPSSIRATWPTFR